MVYKACNTPTGLQYVEGGSEYERDIVEFYVEKGLQHARDEQHAQALLKQGVPCFLIRESQQSQQG